MPGSVSFSWRRVPHRWADPSSEPAQRAETLGLPQALVQVVRREARQSVLIEAVAQTMITLTGVRCRLSACGMTKRPGTM